MSIDSYKIVAARQSIYCEVNLKQKPVVSHSSTWHDDSSRYGNSHSDDIPDRWQVFASTCVNQCDAPPALRTGLFYRCFFLVCSSSFILQAACLTHARPAVWRPISSSSLRLLCIDRSLLFLQSVLCIIDHTLIHSSFRPTERCESIPSSPLA